MSISKTINEVIDQVYDHSLQPEEAKKILGLAYYKDLIADKSIVELSAHDKERVNDIGNLTGLKLTFGEGRVVGHFRKDEIYGKVL